MSTKTYAQLSATTTVADGDLFATYSGAGPLKRITALLVQGYMQTGVVKADGSIPFTGPLLLANGTEANPALTFNSDPDVGFYRIGANNMGVSVNGVKQGDWSITGYTARPSTTTGSGLSLPHGVAPSSPADGDVWTTSAGGQFNRINGTTLQVGYVTTGVNKWTTARTITLAGPITGSVSIDGSADVTLTGSVTGKIATIASATGTAGFSIPDGTAPTSPSTGDMWAVSGSLFYRSTSGTVQLTSPQVLVVQNRSTGDNAESAITAATWTKRTLNTTVINTITGATLSSNTITGLPAGTYIATFASTISINGANSSHAGVTHRLWNTTDSAAIDYSPSLGTGVTMPGTPSLSALPLQTAFTITGTKTIEVDTYWSDSGGAGSISMGVATNGLTAPPTVYSVLTLQKIG